jgi:hypothetical protein
MDEVHIHQPPTNSTLIGCIKGISDSYGFPYDEATISTVTGLN